MNSTSIRSTVPVVVLLVLAGCLGVGGPDLDRAQGPPDAEWTEGNGINETELAHRHFEALRAAGSFSHNATSIDLLDGKRLPPRPRPEWYSPPSFSHEEVDLQDGRFYHRSVHVEYSRGATFVSPEVDASRRKPCPGDDCSWEYRYLQRSDLDTRTQHIDRYRRDRIVDLHIEVMDDWNFTYESTTEMNGHVVYRYEARWTFDRPVHPFIGQPHGTGTLLVTDAGVIRRWETRFSGPARVRVDGESRTVPTTRRSSLTYYAVGNTTVDRPSWVDRARRHDQPPRTKTATAAS